MIVSKTNKWDNSHTALSKYFIERLLQLTDYDELITNRHKTSNGYVLVAEINEVSRLVLARQKSIHRFYTIINESVDSKLNSSIVNDPILKKYHPDIISYYTSLDITSIEKEEKKIKKLQTKTRVFLKRLELTYFDNLKFEFRDINLTSEEKFREKQERLDPLLEVLIPFLIFVGYSIETISKIAILLSSKPIDITLTLFFSIFNLENVNVEFLITASEEPETNKFLEKYLLDCGYKFTKHKLNEFQSDIADRKNITSKLNNDIIKFEVSTLDPNSFIRDTYDKFIKEFIISRDRTSLQYFMDFFDKTYWKLNNNKVEEYRTSGFRHDPINVTSRNSTLIQTLIKVSDYYQLDFNDKTSLHKIDCISESIYFYNLALGSKSIENSLNLLWTSLETLIPYGKYDSDIGNIQYFFPKFLSTGSIGRQLMSFIVRFQTSNTMNGYPLNGIKTNIDYRNHCDRDTIIKWFEYVVSEFDNSNDPYDTLKNCSELLCSKFCQLNELWGKSMGEFPKYGKVKLLKDRIESSSNATKYQLDRIYLHRNQIVHTAKFINEYSNLWAHLEWYVGKILSYFYIKSKEKGVNIKKTDILIELEGECEMINYMIERIKEKRIIDLTLDEKKKIFLQIWQFI